MSRFLMARRTKRNVITIRTDKEGRKLVERGVEEIRQVQA
jgi:hypothetical protein